MDDKVQLLDERKNWGSVSAGFKGMNDRFAGGYQTTKFSFRNGYDSKAVEIVTGNSSGKASAFTGKTFNQKLRSKG